MKNFAASCAFLALGLHESTAFRPAAKLSSKGRFGVTDDNSPRTMTTRFAARKMILLETEEATSAYYDPLNLASTYHLGQLTKRDLESQPCRPHEKRDNNDRGGLWAAAASSTALAPLLLGTEGANAVESLISKDIMNPASFQPVCPASDGFYRFLQTGIEAIVGREKFIEYGPLIAGGLLRVRLELCVVESFFNEAVGPFIQENGVSWVLPLHETVETFLAGSIFALATTFILVGSTKLLTVIITYFDLLVSGNFCGCIAYRVHYFVT